MQDKNRKMEFLLQRVPIPEAQGREQSQQKLKIIFLFLLLASNMATTTNSCTRRQDERGTPVPNALRQEQTCHGS